MTAPHALADFELTDANGRRVLLKDDGTWRYVDQSPAADKDAAKKDEVQAELSLGRANTLSNSCSFDFSLSNKLTYEIRSLVLDFTIQRASGVAYLSHNLGFTVIRPGDTRQRSLRFDGLPCAEIAKLTVSGGDRCEMGELDRFSDLKGACLDRVRVLPSTLLAFEKAPPPPETKVQDVKAPQAKAPDAKP